MYGLVSVVNGRHEFLCTAESDIEKLPTMTEEGTQGDNPADDEICGVGSTAMVVDGTNAPVLYCLMPTNEWAKMAASGG